MTTPEHKHEIFPRKEKITASLSATIFLADKDGKLLLVQDNQEWGGKWAPIAGLVDVGNHETPEHAAVREAKEEMDLSVRLTDVIGVWSYYAYDADNPEVSNPFKDEQDKPKLHVGFAFCGEILDGSFTKQDDEVQNWGFFSLDEIDRMLAEGKIKIPQYNYEAIQRWKDKHYHPLTLLHSNGSS
jgi:ADP-ribose pyrophosphatase YjhB (NUDIX family)